MANQREENIEEKYQQLRRQAEYGERLKELREEKELSIRQLAKALDVSANYLSELERGQKNPSDKMVRDLASFYNRDETVSFSLLGRVPLLAREELENNEVIQHTLADIGKKKNLTDDQKQELYHKIYHIYKDFIEDIEGEED